MRSVITCRRAAAAALTCFLGNFFTNHKLYATINPMILQLFSSPVEFLAFIGAILIALTFHEAAHALAAAKLGDDTARLSGRLSLNPLDHLDPWGTILFLIAGFGWGKPVPVNINNFKNPELDNLKVAIAGPAANLLLAISFGLPVRFFALQLSPTILAILVLVVFINLSLMIFNLIPIPPLDGSKLIGVLFGQDALYRLEQISFLLILGLLVLLNSNTPIVSNFLLGGAQYFFRLITGLSGLSI